MPISFINKICYNLLMTLKEHFDKLPNRLSANFFAMLGFTNFMYPLFGMIATYFSLYIIKDPLVSQDVINVLLAVILLFIPIICVLAIIPIIVLFIFLVIPILKNKTQILIIFSILLIIYFINPFYKSFYFTNGNGIYFAFVPFFGSPIVLLAILIYFILLIIDLNKDDCIKNRELVENKYYKIFVNVFYYYFVITLLVDFFLCLYIFFTR